MTTVRELGAIVRFIKIKLKNVPPRGKTCKKRPQNIPWTKTNMTLMSKVTRSNLQNFDKIHN